MSGLHVYGVPIPDDEARAADDGTTVFEANDQPVTRFRTEQATPPHRCKCSHPRHAHRPDRRGRTVCFASAVCGCAEYREKAA